MLEYYIPNLGEWCNEDNENDGLVRCRYCGQCVLIDEHDFEACAEWVRTIVIDYYNLKERG